MRVLSGAEEKRSGDIETVGHSKLLTAAIETVMYTV